MVKIIRTVVVSGSAQGWAERGRRKLPEVTEMFHILIWAMVTEVDTFIKTHQTEHSTHRHFMCMQIMSRSSKSLSYTILILKT